MKKWQFITFRTQKYFPHAKNTFRTQKILSARSAGSDTFHTQTGVEGATFRTLVEKVLFRTKIKIQKFNNLKQKLVTVTLVTITINVSNCNN